MAIATVGLAAAAVLFLDQQTERKGLLPPAFRAGDSGRSGLVRPRRALAGLLLLAVFWLAIFLPLATLGGPEPDLSAVSRAQLFLLHAVFLLTLGIWFGLGFVRTPPALETDSGHRSDSGVRDGAGLHAGRQFGRQFGLSSRRWGTELGIGLLAGLVAWAAVLLVLIGLGALIWVLGGDEALPRQPPAIVPWIAALPVGLRLALSASAGFAEEIFFRGFLQPRAGVAFSTVLFVLAHAGYGQPLMLVGVTLLSLVFAALVRWRQNIWAAVVAHAVFDALQLLVVIPRALEFLGGGGSLA